MTKQPPVRHSVWVLILSMFSGSNGLLWLRLEVPNASFWRMSCDVLVLLTSVALARQSYTRLVRPVPPSNGWTTHMNPWTAKGGPGDGFDFHGDNSEESVVVVDLASGDEFVADGSPTWPYKTMGAAVAYARTLPDRTHVTVHSTPMHGVRFLRWAARSPELRGLIALMQWVFWLSVAVLIVEIILAS
jgi:hypothetical protein